MMGDGVVELRKIRASMEAAGVNTLEQVREERDPVLERSLEELKY